MKRVSMVIMIAIMISGCDYKYKSHCKKAKYISVKELRANYPKVSAPREVEKAAKIYNYLDGDIILINEKNKGIHVINNRVRETPQNVAFIEIPGNVDMAVKDGYLYVDSFTDLVVLDIRDIAHIKTVNRKEDIFHSNPYQMNLSKDDGECYDYDYSQHGFFVIGTM